MSLERAKDLVDVFNNGNFEDDIEPYFNDLITFFKFVKKYNLLDEIELDQIGYRNWDSELINFLDENGVLGNLSYEDAPEELKNILLLSMKPHDTVDVLNDSNITHLKDVIYKKIGNQELSLEDYDSDFFEHLSEIQGTEGYFRIRPEDLNDLLKDSDASNELFKKDLEDIGDELRSIYYNSENTAYEDEAYEAVYNGLSEYFEGRIDEIPRKVGEKTKYDQYIKIRDFIGNITTFLENNKGGTWSDSFLEYFGGYTSLINNMIYNDDVECIDIRIPDYPDWDRTIRNINEMFLDYI